MMRRPPEPGKGLRSDPGSGMGTDNDYCKI